MKPIPIFGPKGVPPGWVEWAEAQPVPTHSGRERTAIPIFDPSGPPKIWLDQFRPRPRGRPRHKIKPAAEGRGRGRQRRVFTEDESRLAKELRAEGLSALEIADEMCMSVAMVHRLLHGLGISRRLVKLTEHERRVVEWARVRAVPEVAEVIAILDKVAPGGKRMDI